MDYGKKAFYIRCHCIARQRCSEGWPIASGEISKHFPVAAAFVSSTIQMSFYGIESRAIWTIFFIRVGIRPVRIVASHFNSLPSSIITLNQSATISVFLLSGGVSFYQNIILIRIAVFIGQATSSSVPPIIRYMLGFFQHCLRAVGRWKLLYHFLIVSKIRLKWHPDSRHITRIYKKIRKPAIVSKVLTRCRPSVTIIKRWIVNWEYL